MPGTAESIASRIVAEARSVTGAVGATTLEVRVGPFWTAVRTSTGTGLASTVVHEHEHGSVPIARAGELEAILPLELVELLRSESPQEAAVGLAAANALLAPAARGLVEGNAVELLCERAAGRLLAVVGHFPFTDRLRGVCREVWVFEQTERRRPGDLDASSMAELLPHAEVVAVTATTILNRTLEGIVSAIRPGAFSIMLGPSTPMVQGLLDAGFDALCGSVVDDWETVLRAVSQGAVTGQIGGVRRVCRFRDRAV